MLNEFEDVVWYVLVDDCCCVLVKLKELCGLFVLLVEYLEKLKKWLYLLCV